MRGKEIVVDDPNDEIRITPAYAGKSVPVDQRRLLSGDHPRLCGEKNTCVHIEILQKGSPPPMRGKAFAML